jgi:hypothetical protein
LYKMGLAAKIAVANMAMMCCALAVFRYSMDQPPPEKFSLPAGTAIGILAFPVGWLATLSAAMDDPGVGLAFGAVIFLPLNAYVWGYSLAPLVRWCRRHVGRRTVNET